MKKLNYIISFLMFGTFVSAQQFNGKVGINTNAPTETLDVKKIDGTSGTAHAGLLYMKSPGEPLEVPINFMATSNVPSSKKLTIFDHVNATASLVNLLDLYFKRVTNTGISNYDTKISATDYIVAVRSFSLENYSSANPTTPDLEVYTRHNTDPTTNPSRYSQGSPRFYAFVENGTWRINADYAGAKFVTSSGVASNSDRFNIRLQVLVYKKAITKPFGQVMTEALDGTNGSGSAYSVPTPTGF